MRSHHDLMLSLAFASLAVAATARAEVRVLESEQHYLLDASTKAAFRKQLAEQLGHRETGAASRSHGLTDADIETGYELLQEPGHCTLSRVRVVLRLETTLPRWEPTEPPSAALAADGVVEALDVMFGGCPPWGTFTPGEGLVRFDVGGLEQPVLVRLGRFTGTEPESGKDHDEDDISVVPDDGSSPDAVVTGDGAALDLWLWRRTDDTGVAVAGNQEVYDRFRQIVNQPIT